ncbi:metal-sulfur cluster assembly factor [Paraburkholderia silviterrae]|nr:iron-sulfur cluster assembly protein [Paraburkholderia silviterrae]
MPDTTAIQTMLDRVVDPCSIATGVPISLTDMGMVQKVRLDEDGVAHIELRLTSPVCWQAANIIAQVEKVVARAPGVSKVICTVDPASEWLPDMMASGPRAELRRLRPTGVLS